MQLLSLSCQELVQIQQDAANANPSGTLLLIHAGYLDRKQLRGTLRIGRQDFFLLFERCLKPVGLKRLRGTGQAQPKRVMESIAGAAR